MLLLYRVKIFHFFYKSIISNQHLANSSGGTTCISARLFQALSITALLNSSFVLALIFTLIQIKRYVKELCVFNKPFIRFLYFVNRCTRILSLSLSLITGSFMAFDSNFDTDVLHSEYNDSYRYLLLSTRKIHIIMSPLKVDKIRFYCSSVFQVQNHFETL